MHRSHRIQYFSTNNCEKYVTKKRQIADQFFTRRVCYGKAHRRWQSSRVASQSAPTVGDNSLMRPSASRVSHYENHFIAASPEPLRAAVSDDNSISAICALSMIRAGAHECETENYSTQIKKKTNITNRSETYFHRLFDKVITFKYKYVTVFQF